MARVVVSGVSGSVVRLNRVTPLQPRVVLGVAAPISSGAGPEYVPMYHRSYESLETMTYDEMETMTYDQLELQATP